MSQLSISEVAQQVGLRPSAIRYYEQLGILPPAERISGQRRYDKAVVYRLAVVQRARQAGFALDEIRMLFFGFQEGTRAEARWRKLADRKLAELGLIAEQIESMQALLKRMKANCHCRTLEVCGKAIFERGITKTERPPLPLNPESRY
jgi:MerR family transcriptional regulator, redox-sensitive transcriptional activator SoxR